MSEIFTIEAQVGGKFDRVQLANLITTAILVGFSPTGHKYTHKQHYLFQESIEHTIKEDPDCPLTLVGLNVEWNDALGFMDWCHKNKVAYCLGCHAEEGGKPATRTVWIPEWMNAKEWEQLDAEASDVQISIEQLKFMASKGQTLQDVIDMLEPYTTEIPKFELLEPLPVGQNIL